MKFYFQHLTKNIFLTASVIAATAFAGFGQVSIVDNNAQTTNFNGWNGTMPSGWTEAGATYHAGAASTTGGAYSIAGNGFGYQPSGTAPNASVTVTGTYQNNTGAAITSLSIAYEAFNIVTRASRTPNWAVTSSLGSVSGLNWTYNSSTTPAAPSNLTVTLTGLTIADGATFTISFASDRGLGTGSSSMIGMNNVSVTNLTPSVPLFIRLNEFKVVNHGSTNDLSWTTATETTGDVFEIERSNDGQTFHKIATVNAKGAAPSVYTFIDKSPFSGANYYRLKFANSDRSVFYSNIISANVGESKELTITAYPNPMSDNLNVSVNGDVATAAEISLIDRLGRVCNQQTVVKSGIITINTSQLTPGMYFIRYSNGKEQKVIKVTK